MLGRRRDERPHLEAMMSGHSFAARAAHAPRATGMVAGLMAIAVLLAGVLLPGCTMAAGTNAQAFDVSFNLTADPIWRLPKPGAETSVALTFEATNHGTKPIRFPRFDSLRISIQGPDGERRTMVGGHDGIKPGGPVSDPVAPDGTFVLRLTAHLIRGAGDRARLRIEDETGGIWWIEPLTAGPSDLYASYESHRKSAGVSPVWTGRADIGPVPVRIVMH